MYFVYQRKCEVHTSRMFTTIAGIPAHPMFVHLAVAFAPVAALLIIWWALRSTSRGFQILTAVSGVIGFIATIVSRSSGEELLAMQGLSESSPGPLADHLLYANFMLGGELVMLGAFFGDMLLRRFVDNRELRIILRVLGVIGALVVIVFTVLTGHAGAVQAWSN